MYISITVLLTCEPDTKIENINIQEDDISICDEIIMVKNTRKLSLIDSTIDAIEINKDNGNILLEVFADIQQYDRYESLFINLDNLDSNILEYETIYVDLLE